MHEEKTIPAFVKCIRFDSIPLEKAHYTEEGYLVDTPILTSVGIFEYQNPDGSIRRELRLPEHVFKPESLASYEGKPIIVTHDAGKVDKNNVSRESVGTVLSKGFQDGNDVRAKIVVHDTNELKRCGLKELSLGYSLDLIEEQGEWNGQHYDAIQTNIVINHLALVANARAGEQARLNIDGKEKHSEEGGKTEMAKNKANTRRDSDDPAVKLAEEVLANAGVVEPEKTAVDNEGEMTLEEKVQAIKERQDSEEKTEPTNLDEANEIIERKDEDIKTLLEALETQQAEKDFAEGLEKQDEEDKPAENQDNETVATSENEETNTDEDEQSVAEEEKPLNVDAMDKAFSERLAVVRTGDKLNLDGLEKMSLSQAKKTVIAAINPNMRLDGKSDTYINAAYDMAVASLNEKKDGVSMQRKAMYGGSHRTQRADSANKSLAAAAREKMISGGKN